MATSKFFIIDNPNEDSDGIVQLRTKENVGRAWNQEAPNGMFINCTLENYVIISKEEYNELKK